MCISPKVIFHVFVCLKRKDEPDEVETQNHVDNHYGSNTLTVAEPTTAHALRGIKVVIGLELPLQVTEISILLL